MPYLFTLSDFQELKATNTLWPRLQLNLDEAWPMGACFIGGGTEEDDGSGILAVTLPFPI